MNNLPAYRAWHIANKTMHDVFGWKYRMGAWGDVLSQIEPDQSANNQGGAILIKNRYEYWDYASNFILMQSTGLKDKHGKMIFEGDILKIEDEPAAIFFVEWFGNQGYPAFDLNTPFCDDMNSLSYISQSGDYEYEVIGNIHQHPELL